MQGEKAPANLGFRFFNILPEEVKQRKKKL